MTRCLHRIYFIVMWVGMMETNKFVYMWPYTHTAHQIGPKPSAILVEIFVNEKLPAYDKIGQGNVICAVTRAIESCIVKQPENMGKNVRYICIRLLKYCLDRVSIHNNIFIYTQDLCIKLCIKLVD